MKLVKLRIKKGLRHKIRDSQKSYIYLCYLEDIRVDDFVVCEVRLKHIEDFRVGRVEEVIPINSEEDLERYGRPYSFVVAKIENENFDVYCKGIMNKKFRLYSKYNGKSI